MAWPTTIVRVPNGIPRPWIVALRAIPVMIPGRAMGRTRANAIVSRPKKRKRWTANDASEPRTIASRVAWRATVIDRAKASRTPSLAYASPNQRRLYSLIGQIWIRWALNA